LVSAISQSSLPALHSLRPLRGFDFRICQMRMRVSTNRGDWQMRRKSRVKPGLQAIFRAKANFGSVFGPLRT
jgi:hypothetical protein